MMMVTIAIIDIVLPPSCAMVCDENANKASKRNLAYENFFKKIDFRVRTANKPKILRIAKG